GWLLTAAECPEQKFNAVRNPQLVENSKQMVLNGVLTEPEPVCDFAIGQPLGHPTYNFLFAFRKQAHPSSTRLFHRGSGRNGVENQGDLLIIDPDPPFVYLANALAQRLRRFSTIKNSASSCLKRFNHGFGPRRLQQYDNPARLRGASKFPEYPEPALCIFVREYAQDN